MKKKKHKGFWFKRDAYVRINKFYGKRRARRSGLPLMNHINEGIDILVSLGASLSVIDAFCLHPIFQGDKNLRENIGTVQGLDPYVVALVMEYRKTANAYDSRMKIKSYKDIRLGNYPFTASRK